MEDVVITSAVRTPMGGFQGDLDNFSAPELGGKAIKGAMDNAGIDCVEEVIMGNVLGAGQGQAPARQASFAAGLDETVPATTLNKMCGSGMQAAILATETLLAGTADIIIAGGMESMTNAPYLTSRHRAGSRVGHDSLKDSMFLDGLEDAYEEGTLMGVFAEQNAQKYGFTRADQDAYALEGLARAQRAIAEGRFVDEIAPVTVSTRNGNRLVAVDEQPGKANPDKIPALKPAFAKDGTVTAANASSISDGAAALVLTRASVAQRLGMKVCARIVATDCHAHEPADFPSAPVPAMRKVMAAAGWSVGEVDLFEVNEAFAVVAMIAMQELGIPHDKLNVNGGACALGHPIGASGARIIATLLAALKKRGLKRGVAGICLGGGEATAMALELV